MIVFHSVTKELGRRGRRRIIFDNIDLVILPRSHYAILGPRGSGKTSLLQLLSGASVPSRGWIERRCTVSMAGAAGLVRYATGLTTARQLARMFASIYLADPRAVVDCVEAYSGLGRAMDIPVVSLVRHARQKLGLALFYALPCDFYLFDAILSTKLPDMKEIVDQAYMQRRSESGIIFTTSQPRAARAFGGKGGVIHGGKLSLFESVDEAIDVYHTLPLEGSATASTDIQQVANTSEEEGII